MELTEAIKSRRTIHDFRPGAIPEGVLERAIDLAQWAPNHKLTHPWRFTKVGNDKREALYEQNLKLREAKLGEPLPREVQRKIRAKMFHPDVLLAVSCLRSNEALRQKEDLAAVACAVQNLMLSLWSEGVGCKWGTGALTREAKTYDLLEIDPKTQEIVGFLWIGLAEKTPVAPPRPERKEIYREV